jgi:hypothetical protein
MKRINTSSFIVIFVIFFLGQVFHQSILLSQYIDPNRDYPVFSRDYVGTPRLFSPISAITIDNYDNFYLGVDFAEVSIMGNPGNPLQFVAAWNNTNPSFGAKPWNTSNGLDWSSVNPSWGAVMWGDPVVAYDSLGNVYFENMYGTSSTVQGTKISVSSNNGQNWSVVNGNTGNDKNWIAAVQTGGPYSNYVFGGITPGNVIRSTDRGASFSVITSLTNSYPGMMPCIGANVLNGNNVQGGCTYFVTNTGPAGYAVNYNFYCSTNGGTSFDLKSTQSFSGYVGTWLNGRHSVENMRTRPYPMITADNSFGPFRGRLYVVYALNNPNTGSAKPDIICRYSTNQGTSWSSPALVNDDPNTINNHQYFPAVWCDVKTGKLYISFWDTRDTPTSDSVYVYATYSTDGGATFAPNKPISNKKFKINCTNCGGGGTPTYLGDYDGIYSNGKVSMLAWTDFRNGNFANYTAYFPDFAMKLDKSLDSLNPNAGYKIFTMQIPSVKLYTDTVLVTASVTPTPGTGSFVISFPNTNVLATFPGVVPVQVGCTGGVPLGNYILTITAKGPNGTPVHIRTASIKVSNGVIGINNTSSIVNNYQLFQNYPNPFNPVTKIEYYLLKPSIVKFKVFDIVGKEVAYISEQKQEAGKNLIMFNAGNLSSGVYFYRIETPEFSDTKSMILVK